LRKHAFAVAEACNHPNCLVLPFGVELIRLAAKAAPRAKTSSMSPIFLIDLRYHSR
jgi:hypothetical protein